MNSDLPPGASWDDAQIIRHCIKRLAAQLHTAERVRAEYRRVWIAAGQSATCPAVKITVGRAAANAWVRSLTLKQALALK